MRRAALRVRSRRFRRFESTCAYAATLSRGRAWRVRGAWPSATNSTIIARHRRDARAARPRRTRDRPPPRFAARADARGVVVSLLVAGIDGGQSSTVARHRRRDAGASSGAARRARPTRSAPARNRRACATRCTARSTTHAATRACPSGCALRAIVAGVSGYDGTRRGRPPQLPSQRVQLMHDAPIAHAGALGGRPGVVVIGGTGSVVYGRADERLATHARRLGISLRRRGQRVSHRDRRARDADARLRRRRRVARRRARSGLRLLRQANLCAHSRRGFYNGEITRATARVVRSRGDALDAIRGARVRGADRLAELVRRPSSADAPRRWRSSAAVFADAGFRDRVAAGDSGAVPESARSCSRATIRPRARCCSPIASSDLDVGRSCARERRSSAARRLIVSVQAWRGSAIDDPAFIAAMARAAQEGGAVAVRVDGVADLHAVRARVAFRSSA